MDQPWLRAYVQLQFRMDKAIRKFTESRFVDYYYGPTEWKAAVESEPETPAAELVRAAAKLLDTLSEQGFEALRATYLSKQVVAIETVCRKLNGETFALEEEVQRYMLKYWIWPEEYAQKAIDFLKDPFREAYVFTYYYGRHLMKPWLAGPDRQQVFQRFLMEQWCPSNLVSN